MLVFIMFSHLLLVLLAQPHPPIQKLSVPTTPLSFSRLPITSDIPHVDRVATYSIYPISIHSPFMYLYGFSFHRNIIDAIG
jgi:hypothetical protein